MSAVQTRDGVPVWLCRVTREMTATLYVAAETSAEAEEDAQELVCFSDFYETDDDVASSQLGSIPGNGKDRTLWSGGENGEYVTFDEAGCEATT